jgi:hypothetical protein
MNSKIKIKLLVLLSCIFVQGMSQEFTRWKLAGDASLVWNVKAGDSHMNHTEMSGFYMSAIVNYGVEKGILKQNVELIFPMLRTIPNNTFGSLSHTINNEDIPVVKINGKPVTERPKSFDFGGILGYLSNTDDGMQIKHQLFPSVDRPLFIDKIEIRNANKASVTVSIPATNFTFVTDKDKSLSGPYLVKAASDKVGSFELKPNESITYSVIYTAKNIAEEDRYVSPDFELRKREKFIKETLESLVFESPDKIVNSEFDFSKIRTSESIFNTKRGLMHSPGGGVFYAAIWANDQAEYTNPFFPYLGNIAGNESAINSFRHFARYINDDYKPIPRSIIAEGTDIYWGQGDKGYELVDGDRGDMAMIAYGASRFALAYGKVSTARELWPLIEWCLEYCRRKLNNDGVVTSNTDELEGRFLAGKANLNTSSLYYDALNSALYLSKELGIDQGQQDKYHQQAMKVKESIEKYFGANVQGFDTYRYYEGNELLRSWICAPLTMNIYTRAIGTVNAIFSEKLWTKDGLVSESGNAIYWDRATLYAFRGVFAAGETDRGLKYLDDYSKRRLLGDHIPYPDEMGPEGFHRQLAAEAALYCRIITEGLFGIRPVGLSKFTFSPRLPSGWNYMKLKKIKAFDRDFNISIDRAGKKLFVKVFDGEKVFLNTEINDGEIVTCQL